MKDVEIFTGNPKIAVDLANAALKLRGKDFLARPIEFCKIDQQTLAIIINYRQKAVTNIPIIAATIIPAQWEFTASLNHPVISFGGTLWFFGIL